MAWSAPSADRPLPNEGALRYGLAAAALPLWAPFLAAAGAGVAWWWATAWTRQTQIPGFAPAVAPRRIEVKPAAAPVAVEPAAAVSVAPVAVAAPAAPVVSTLAAPAELAEVAADVHAVAELETAPLHSDAEAVKAAVAEVVAGIRGDGPRPVRKKPAGPKATV